ncbi:hypothetical protein D8B26_001254 [Coccidioides posadasii str. Silveira]|uniref:Predicted protein n=1 Tax=Coccidioides posadasii (strain RMSCC 757 / Silveira) TaxID=443226 RepID=E9DA54_COCPS|nr:predicted protein [Coccidioides posadasii str. Silveira]QVM06547.1 hypothetical protein D8B26_001254 [Coccidioides posadasii str. Silveira]
MSNIPYIDSQHVFCYIPLLHSRLLLLSDSRPQHSMYAYKNCVVPCRQQALWVILFVRILAGSYFAMLNMGPIALHFLDLLPTNLVARIPHARRALRLRAWQIWLLNDAYIALGLENATRPPRIYLGFGRAAEIPQLSDLIGASLTSDLVSAKPQNSTIFFGFHIVSWRDHHERAVVSLCESATKELSTNKYHIFCGGGNEMSLSPPYKGGYGVR